MAAQDIQGPYGYLKARRHLPGAASLTAGVPLTRRTLLRGTVFNILQFVLTGALLPILVTPLIFYRLGPDGYGLWALVFTLGSWFYFLDLGINMGITKFAGQYAGVADRAMLEKLFCTTFYLYAALGVVAAAVSAVAVHPLLKVFVGAHQPADDVALALILIFHFASAALKNLGGILAGLQELERAGKIAIAVGAGQALAIWIWSTHGSAAPLSTLAAIYLATTAVHGFLLTVLLSRSKIGAEPFPLSWNPARIDFAFLKTLTGFSGVLYLTHLMVNVLLSDRLYLGWIRAPLDQVAEYHLGALLVGKTAAFLSVFAAVIYPAAAAFDALKDTRRIEELTRRTFRMYAFVGYFLFVFLCVFADSIFRVWLGRPVPFAVDITWFLAGWGLTGILGGLGAVAAGVGRPQIQLKSCLVAVLSMAILYPLLIRPFGARGLAMAISISFVLSGIVFIGLFRKQVLPLDWSLLLGDGLLKPVLCAVAAVVPVHAALVRAGADSRVEFGAMAAGGFGLSILLYAGLAWITGLLRKEDLPLDRPT